MKKHQLTWFTIALLVCLAFSLPAGAKPVLTQSCTTFYLAEGEKCTQDFEISGLFVGDTVKDLTISDPEVASLTAILFAKRDDGVLQDARVVPQENRNLYVTGIFSIRKPGTAKISMQIGEETFSFKYKVLPYKNPLAQLRLTGVSSKNLKGKFKTQGRAELQIEKDAPSGLLKLKAAPGWKIVSVNWMEVTLQGNTSHYESPKGTTAVSLRLPKMKKDGHYILDFTMVNQKTKGKNYLVLAIN